MPVAADDWYQRRRDDAEGRFFRAVTSQDKDRIRGEGSRQGIYVLTAAGKLLYSKNIGHLPADLRDELRQVLADWRKLPEAERRPGAVAVGDAGDVDRRFERTPPAGALVLTVSTRILAHDDRGRLCRGTCGFAPAERAARDHLWVTEDEWRRLLPAMPVVGRSVPVPASLVERILRFHLVDNTRGEPPLWERRQVRRGYLGLRVEEVRDDRVRLRLDGSALLATGDDPARSKRGFEGRLLGELEYDPRTRTVQRFDLVALGDSWGEGEFTRGARPGRTPLGIAFELARGDTPADRVPPQGARVLSDYLGTSR